LVDFDPHVIVIVSPACNAVPNTDHHSATPGVVPDADTSSAYVFPRESATPVGIVEVPRPALTTTRFPWAQPPTGTVRTTVVELELDP
jgi:hypothetical protein